MPLDAPHPWTIFGPPKLYLTRSEVITCLRANDKHLRRLIREGRFPPGTQETAKGEMVWRAEDVAAYLWLRTRGAAPGAEAGDDDDG